MAKILRPRRGKNSYATGQNLVLAKGEVFFSYSDTNFTDFGSTSINEIYLGNGSSPINELNPFISNDFSRNACLWALDKNAQYPLVSSEFYGINGAQRKLINSNSIYIKNNEGNYDYLFSRSNNSTSVFTPHGLATTYIDDAYISTIIINEDDIISRHYDTNGSSVGGWGRSHSLVEAISDNSIVNLIYPVGSIYLSANNTNPGTLFSGTTWELLPGNYALKTIASGTGASTASASNTGSTTLTAAQSGLPAHKHTASGGAVTDKAAFNTNNSSTFNTGSGGVHKHTYNRTYNGQNLKSGTGGAFTNYHTNANAETLESTSHTHVVPAHAHTIPAHGHGFTQPTISNATTQNASAGHTHTAGMPQNISVYAWKRTN